MAKVLDDVLEETSVTSSLDEPIVEEEQPNEQPASQDEDLPEKYRGKTAKEIALMHQEAEKLIGRQGSEVGELRKVVDDFIKTQTSKDLKTQEEQVSEEDFFVDPASSINRAIENHPSVKEAKLAAKEMKKAETTGKIQAEFPDVAEIVQDSAFIDWIKASKIRTELFLKAETEYDFESAFIDWIKASKIRTELFLKAEIEYDFESAKEILSTWKEKQEVGKKVMQTSKVDREQQLKAADTSVSSSTESVPKKKYRRSDIIKLMQTDPDRYDAMSSEIMAAYREGRVI